MSTDREEVLRTYRYLRWAIVVLVATILVSLAVEWVRAGCVLTSISAYYFSPARGILVGVLCAIGACLVIYKGNSSAEDALLNLAGFLAFATALVPPAPDASCGRTDHLVDGADLDAAIANNMITLIVGAAVGLIVWMLAKRSAGVRSAPGRAAAVVRAAGFAVAAGYVGLFVHSVWPGVQSSFFRDSGHFVAALAFFAAIVLVVMLNAASVARQRKRAGARTSTAYANWYAAIAAAMVVSYVVIAHVLHGWLLPQWSQWLLVLEIVLIVEFAVFWLVQTFELRGQIDRTETPPVR